MAYFKKFVLYVIAVMMLVANCTNKPNIEVTIRKQIEHECLNDSCTVNLNQALQFDWDKMVAFSDAAPPEVINDAIGIKYPNFVEFTRPFIFLKKNKIVHYENNILDNEGPIDGRVIFNHPDSVKYAIYFRKNTIFKVKKVHFGREIAYLLSQ